MTVVLEGGVSGGCSVSVGVNGAGVSGGVSDGGLRSTAAAYVSLIILRMRGVRPTPILS